jgi:hypothetical protein
MNQIKLASPSQNYRQQQLAGILLVILTDMNHPNESYRPDMRDIAIN